MDCNICCENINGHNKLVTCGFCDFGACSRCTERYLLETHDDAHCMSCRKEWDQGILDKLLTKNFLTKEYRKRRKDVLLDREKSLLPRSQPDVDIELADRAREKLRRQLVAEKQALIQRIKDIDSIVDDIRYGRDMERVEPSGSVTTRKCPVGDCRGFLDQQWKCGICDAHICKDCNEPICEDHVCDPDTVSTIKLIKKDSKPCPSCGTTITKIDGCDQMWCTLPTCHTAFSWRSGKKVFGVIHNPHYIQFSMANGTVERDPQDVPCGGLPNMGVLFNMVRRYTAKELHNKFSEPFYGVSHMTNVEEHRYRVTDVVNTNTDLRVRYLLNEISEDCMAKLLIQRDTARKKKKAFHDIIVMIIHTAADIFHVLLDSLYKKTEILQHLEVLHNLRKYANQQFERVGTIYNCKYPVIISTWEFKKYCK